ncbi:MAG: Oxidoreductase YdhF [Phycisphaerales bacterium]|nr:Oxidoreductase YdhF [Phycisphaerales bacterium]
MRTQPIGRTGLVSTRLAYGCWRLVGTMDPAEVTPDREAAGRRAVAAAVDAGYTLFDHADIYGRGVCERVFGDALRDMPGVRDRVLLATKCGIVLPAPGVRHLYDSSPGHIVRSCEASLKRLGTDRVDLYQLHRPDLLMDPAAVAAAFDQLRQQGKARFFGVSNFPPTFTAALQKACPFPLAVNQVEMHLARLDPLYDGTIDQCLAEGMTPLAWSPLGGGVLGDDSAAEAAHPRASVLKALHHELDAVAAAHGVKRSTIALAWLLAHPAGVIPIVGSIDPVRIRAAAAAADVTLTRDDWYRLLVAARGEPLP